MEFKSEKEEVVERYERTRNYLVVSEDELRQLYEVNKNYSVPIFMGDYEQFRDETKQGNMLAWIEFHGYRIQFVLKLEKKDKLESVRKMQEAYSSMPEDEKAKIEAEWKEHGDE